MLSIWIGLVFSIGKYDMFEVHPGGFHAQIIITADEDVNDGWEVDLNFDEKVRLGVRFRKNNTIENF